MGKTATRPSVVNLEGGRDALARLLAELRGLPDQTQLYDWLHRERLEAEGDEGWEKFDGEERERLLAALAETRAELGRAPRPVNASPTWHDHGQFELAVGGGRVSVRYRPRVAGGRDEFEFRGEALGESAYHCRVYLRPDQPPHPSPVESARAYLAEYLKRRGRPAVVGTASAPPPATVPADKIVLGADVMTPDGWGRVVELDGEGAHVCLYDMSRRRHPAEEERVYAPELLRTPQEAHPQLSAHLVYEVDVEHLRVPFTPSHGVRATLEVICDRLDGRWRVGHEVAVGLAGRGGSLPCIFDESYETRAEAVTERAAEVRAYLESHRAAAAHENPRGKQARKLRLALEEFDAWLRVEVPAAGGDAPAPQPAASPRTDPARRARLRRLKAEKHLKTAPGVAELLSVVGGCDSVAALDAYSRYFLLEGDTRPSFLTADEWETVRRQTAARREHLSSLAEGRKAGKGKGRAARAGAPALPQADSAYAADDRPEALLAAVEGEQRGRLTVIGVIEEALRAGVNPKNSRRLTGRQRDRLGEELAALRRDYEGQYAEVASAFSAEETEELRRRVEGGGACAEEQPPPPPAPPAGPHFGAGTPFGQAFKACAADADAHGYLYWLGRVGDEQVIVRTRLRYTAGLPPRLYVDAQIVAGGERLGGAQLLGLARMVARSDERRRPCRVRLAGERYRGGRVHTTAQGLVSAAAERAAGTLAEGGWRELVESAVARYGSKLRAAAALRKQYAQLLLLNYYADQAGDADASERAARLDVYARALGALSKTGGGRGVRRTAISVSVGRRHVRSRRGAGRPADKRQLVMDFEGSGCGGAEGVRAA